MQIEDLTGLWRSQLESEFQKPRMQELSSFVSAERAAGLVFPSAADTLNALRMTPLEAVRVLILGQDPYHDHGQAHGLSFSVPRGMPLPPSLRNIFKELQTDLGIAPAPHGCLEAWAHQGVLLLNTVLTVRAHEPNSHRGKGWEELTSRIIECVNERPRVAFVLWGKPAQEKADLISERHLIIRSAHPSPLSAHRGFFGSRPFSRINEFLVRSGQTAIDWGLEARR